MTTKEKRLAALSAARGEARYRKFEPKELTGDNMVAILDNFTKMYPDRLAAKWYASASDSQINLFKKNHENWRRDNV